MARRPSARLVLNRAALDELHLALADGVEEIARTVWKQISTALADRLGVGDRVEIRAVRERDAYVAELSGASVAMLLSEFETHPMAAIEAIRLGIPMLVANNSGLTELADKGLPVGASSGAAANGGEPGRPKCETDAPRPR